MVSPSVCARRIGINRSFLAVHVKRHRSIIGHHGKRGRGRSRRNRAIGARRGVNQAIAQFGTRENDRAHLGEVLVAAGVIRVDVSIDQKADRLIRDLMNRRHNLLAQRRKLAVHHENAVRPNQDADGAALPLERIEIIGQLGGLDLDLAEIRGVLRSPATAVASRATSSMSEYRIVLIFIGGHSLNLELGLEPRTGPGIGMLLFCQLPFGEYIPSSGRGNAGPCQPSPALLRRTHGPISAAHRKQEQERAEHREVRARIAHHEPKP